CPHGSPQDLPANSNPKKFTVSTVDCWDAPKSNDCEDDHTTDHKQKAPVEFFSRQEKSSNGYRSERHPARGAFCQKGESQSKIENPPPFASVIRVQGCAGLLWA